MFRRAKKLFGSMLLGAIGALLLTLAAQSVLLWQVRKGVQSDLSVSAHLMLERATKATQTAIDTLNQLALSSGLSCTSDHRYAYSKAVRSVPWIDTIGLVDRNGNLVCTDMGQSARQVGLLEPYESGSKDVTLSLSSGSDDGQALSLLVIRHVTNGRRLVARVPGELVRLDPVRNDLRRFRVAMLSLGAGTPWYMLEPIEMSPEMSVKVLEASEYLPFEVQISVPDKALMAISKNSRQIIHVLGVVIGLIGLVGAYYFSCCRPSEGERILRALDDGEIVPFLQPIVDLDTGAINGCEVLARWNKADGSVISPHEFIPLAQNCRLTREVTYHIMEEARDLLSPLIIEGERFKVSFNLFSHQLIEDTIVADIREIFHDSKLTYGNLIFEISDRVEITDMALTKDVITQIQALGAEIALDDVGSGHSGLYNLTTIGVDILKLDKLMVDSLKDGFVGYELVRSLIGLAKTLDIGVIAEGIESEEQVAQLRKLGVSVAQGYLFSPPLPGSAFVDLVAASQARRRRRAGTETVAENDAGSTVASAA